MRILLVEDERRVASFVSRALRENAYTVDLAENGEKALELAARTLYDSILLDVRLPGSSQRPAFSLLCRRTTSSASRTARLSA